MSPQKTQEMPFPRSKISKFSGGACPPEPLEGIASGARIFLSVTRVQLQNRTLRPSNNYLQLYDISADRDRGE